MVTALLLASVVGTYSLNATDDVWIYPHSDDQTGDPLLRVWGDGASSVGDPGEASFSFSLVRFDVGSVKEAPKDVKKATLVLWVDGETTMTEADSKASPLEVRLVDAGFDEKKWNFEMYSRFMPVAGAETLIGKGSAKPSVDGKPFKLEVDLLGGKADFRKAIEGKKSLGFALSSKIEAGGPDGPYYRIHSRSSEEKYRPVLVLEF
jgi:hypothetical protein